MNKIALWMNVCADDWTAEISTIANNDLVTLCDFIGRIIGRIMKKKWNSTTDPETSQGKTMKNEIYYPSTTKYYK